MATYTYTGAKRYQGSQDNQQYRKYSGNQESTSKQNTTTYTSPAKGRSVSEDLKYRRFLRAGYMNLLSGSNSFVIELLNHFGVSLDLITAIRNVITNNATQKDFNLVRDAGLDPGEINLNDLALRISMKHYLNAEETTNLLAIIKNVVEGKH